MIRQSASTGTASTAASPGLDGPPVGALAFIDARCTHMIADAVRTLAGSRPVVLHCRPEIAAGFARLGIEGLPGVRLAVLDEHH